MSTSYLLKEELERRPIFAPIWQEESLMMMGVCMLLVRGGGLSDVALKISTLSLGVSSQIDITNRLNFYPVLQTGQPDGTPPTRLQSCAPIFRSRPQ